MTWRDKLKSSTLPETTVKLVTDGQLMAEHEQLAEQLKALENKPAGSLAGSGRAVIEAKMADLEGRMRDSIIEVRLRALSRSRRPDDARSTWAELADKHQPRVESDGTMDPRDRLNGGVNSATFPVALVRECIVAVDNEVSSLSDDEWENLMVALTDGQFQELVNACWAINKNLVNIPFLLAGSPRTPTTGDE